MPLDSRTAFISYAREDSQFALQLAKDLKASGASVWLDQLDIRPGQRWDKAVEEALNTCSRMLVVLSSSSVDSSNVMDEVSYALEEQKTVIPALHKECKIPFRLRRLQYINFQTDYAGGLSELLEIIGSSGKADAATATQEIPDVAPEAPPAPPAPQPIHYRPEPVVVATPRQETHLPNVPRFSRFILWTARILASFASVFILYVAFTTTSSTDNEVLPFFIPLCLAQLAAWKWERQGIIAAIALALLALISGPRGTSAAVFFMSSPTMFFIIHWAMVRKSRPAAGV